MRKGVTAVIVLSFLLVAVVLDRRMASDPAWATVVLPHAESPIADKSGAPVSTHSGVGSHRSAARAVVHLQPEDPEKTYARRTWDVLIANRPQRLNATWLLVGSDSRVGERARSDALMLARIDRGAGRAMVVSIPRDMRVWIPGHGYSKINHALAYGDLPLLERTVQRALGVHVDHTVAIDFSGFIQLIDALGGVSLRVDRQLDYDDATDGTHIHLKPGLQHLTGKQALGFVRFRHDAMADTGRMRRQQQLLSAVGKMKVPIERWWAVSGAVLRLPAHVRTDATAWEALSEVGRLSVAPNLHLKTRTLRGINRVDPRSGLWYFYVDARDVSHLQAELEQFDREK